ncbi:unnamed protein product [Closterium sp. NIES-54]
MAGPEERGGRGAGDSREAQAQGQPRDPTMSLMQPSLGPPRDEPRVFGLDKFNGGNFAEWSFKMENIFDHYDLLEVMEGTEKRSLNNPEKSPWVRKSAQGYLLLGQALGSSQIRHIKSFQREPEKGPKAWAALKGVYAPAIAAIAMVLERQNLALRIEEDKAVEEGVQKFFDLLTRLEGAALNYRELQKKTKVLALLPESRSSLIINLNHDLPRLSLEDQASARDMVVEGAEDEEEEGLEAVTTMEAAEVAAMAMTTRTTDAVADGYKLRTPAQGQEGRGAGGGRGRGRGGHGSRGGGAANMKNGDNKSESRDDRFPGQVFFVSTQAPAALEKDDSFEEPASVGKVPNLAANLILVRRLQKAGMDTSSKGAKTYTTRIGERVLWDLHEDRDVYNKMWQILLVPMSNERQVAASVSTMGEAVGSGYGADDGAKAKESNKCKPGETSKQCELEESAAAAKE